MAGYLNTDSAQPNDPSHWLPAQRTCVHHLGAPQAQAPVPARELCVDLGVHAAAALEARKHQAGRGRKWHGPVFEAIEQKARGRQEREESNGD